MIRAALAAAALWQAGAEPTAPPADGTRLAVYLVTMGPGPRIWERFGHNAILIRDTVTGESVAYDYGRFSFDQERFFTRFARGDMRYWMGREDGVALLNAYIRAGRAVFLQELALPPANRVQLQHGLETNYEADQGRYRYDYYRDNCSTRIRDAIDAVVGGAIRATLDTFLTEATYRWHTRRSLENNPLNYFAVDAGLGPAVDLPVTRLQETFLPERLQAYARTVLWRGPDGRISPLVRSEIILAEGGRWSVPEEPGDWTLGFLGAGLGLAAVLALAGRLAGARPRARALFGVLAGLWVTTAAIGGVVLVFLGYFSGHLVAFRNENVLQFNLFAATLLPILPGALRREPRRARPALVLAWLVAAGSVVGLALKGLPGWGQANGEIIAFALPAHLGLAAGLWAALKSPAVSAAPPAPA